jgi:N6-adenosine-specific RNA methylase IME4
MTPLFGSLRGKYYGAILVDAPTRFETWGGATEVAARGSKTKPRTTHYRTMTTAEIKALPVAALAADDCVLFLWCTWPTIKDSFAIIESWNFTYKTCAFSWMKADPYRLFAPPRMGMGYWTRANTEHCLLATRGKPRRLHADVRQAIIDLPREHSRKPDCVYGRIERLVPGPYLELFARQSRVGWDSWGDQTGKFDEQNTATAANATLARTDFSSWDAL